MRAKRKKEDSEGYKKTLEYHKKYKEKIKEVEKLKYIRNREKINASKHDKEAFEWYSQKEYFDKKDG